MSGRKSALEHACVSMLEQTLLCLLDMMPMCASRGPQAVPGRAVPNPLARPVHVPRAHADGLSGGHG